MSEKSAVAKTEVVDEDLSIVEDRRLRVQALRLRRLSAKAIAAVLGERVKTVEADLEAIRMTHVDRFGPVPQLDPAQEIGWAVADFEEMESVAWLEFHTLKQEAQQRRLSPMFVARARQGWIRTAAMMRVLRLKLLAEHGYLVPAASSQNKPGQVVSRADDIRAMLRQEGLLLEVGDGNGNGHKPVLDDTPFKEELDEYDASKWLDDGGFFGS